MLKVLVGLLAIYLALVGLLFVMQRKLQYFPDPRLVEPGGRIGRRGVVDGGGRGIHR